MSTVKVILKGGPGSGHHGHVGRPGKRGGSLPGKGGGSVPWWGATGVPRRPAVDLTPPAPKGWQKRGYARGAVYIRAKREDPKKSVQILCEPHGGREGKPITKVALWLFGKRQGLPGWPHEALYEYEGLKLKPAIDLCDHFIRTGKFPESEFATKIDQVPE